MKGGRKEVSKEGREGYTPYPIYLQIYKNNNNNKKKEERGWFEI